MGQNLTVGNPHQRVIAEPAAGKIGGNHTPVPAQHHFLIRSGAAVGAVGAGRGDFAPVRRFSEHTMPPLYTNYLSLL